MSKQTLITIKPNVKPEQFQSMQAAAVVRAAQRLGRKDVPLPRLINEAKKTGLDTVCAGGLEASVKYHVNLLRKTNRAIVKRVEPGASKKRAA